MVARTGAVLTQAPVEWQAHKLSGQDALAVRVSKKLKNDELFLTGFAGTRLRRTQWVPLWRGNHVAVKRLAEDFARYLYLPRLKDSSVLAGAIRRRGALDLAARPSRSPTASTMPRVDIEACDAGRWSPWQTPTRRACS